MVYKFDSVVNNTAMCYYSAANGKGTIVTLLTGCDSG